MSLAKQAHDALYRKDLVQRRWEEMDAGEREDWADVLTILLLVATSGRPWPVEPWD